MIKKSLINQLAKVNVVVAFITFLNCIITVHGDREPQPNHYEEIITATVSLLFFVAYN